MALAKSKKLQSKRDPYIEWTPNMRITVHVLQTDFRDERNTMAKRIAFTRRHQQTLPGYSVDSPVPWQKISRQYVERQSQIEAQRQKWDNIVSMDFHDRSSERAIMQLLIDREKTRAESSRIIKVEYDQDDFGDKGVGAGDRQDVRDELSTIIKEEAVPDVHRGGLTSDSLRLASSGMAKSTQTLTNTHRRPAVSAEPPIIARQEPHIPVRTEPAANLQRRNALASPPPPHIAFTLPVDDALESYDDPPSPKTVHKHKLSSEPRHWINAYYIHDHLTPHQRQTLEHMMSFPASRHMFERFESLEEFSRFVESHREESEGLLVWMLRERFGEDEGEIY
ncbi:hypothetical protein EJ03DRAFT_332908 [Teratosphaeria nubilosa]|uniref:Uncharacterized protein n=1 Tax=Teratosphaeria nubilosa TaxID=161662 RepID=A0A6G1LNV1_9PEZI|nr:hypothetical protein EJ03DRAFT_332908 [Teratosphaeria nubilosa]